MPTDPIATVAPVLQPPPQLARSLGLLALCLTLAIGTASALWSLHQLRTTTEREARTDAQAMAQSVAHTLAQQIGRAVRVGIPLADIPGVPAYLQRTLEQAPGLAFIALHTEDDTLLHTTSTSRSASDRVRAPIQVQGRTAGTVVVGTAAAALAQGLAWAQALCALVVLGLGLLGGWLAARGPGQRLEHQRQRLQAGLHGARPPEPPPGASDDGVAQALQALADGHQQAQAHDAAVAAYAQELLAVDFDQRLQAHIARIVPDHPHPGKGA